MLRDLLWFLFGVAGTAGIAGVLIRRVLRRAIRSVDWLELAAGLVAIVTVVFLLGLILPEGVLR